MPGTTIPGSSNQCPTTSELRTTFDQHDADSNGSLDAEEFSSYLNEGKPEANSSRGGGGSSVASRSLFDTADSNNDNQIDFEEFQAFSKQAICQAKGLVDTEEDANPGKNTAPEKDQNAGQSTEQPKAPKSPEPGGNSIFDKVNEQVEEEIAGMGCPN